MDARKTLVQIARMGDRYVHLSPFTSGWDNRQDNLLALARHLAVNAGAIRQSGGLAFGVDMTGHAVPDAAANAPSGPRPPLAHGPDAGIGREPGEDWPTYCQRAFGIYDHHPAMVWLQSPMWSKTDPSVVGAALRIAYMLDYGVPHDHVEIAMGQAYSDYDTSGFIWEKLEMLPSDVAPENAPDRWRRQPAWIGAVELSRRQSEVRSDFLLPPGEAPFSAGLPTARRTAFASTFGPLPSVYHDFLLLSGLRTTAGQAGGYADRLESFRAAALQRIVTSARPDDDPVPPDAIFIGLQDGRHPEFILSGQRNDSPVFRFDAETGRVTQTGLSIFVWIEQFMALAGPPASTPPPDDTPPAPAPDGIRQSLQRLFGRLFR